MTVDDTSAQDFGIFCCCTVLRDSPGHTRTGDADGRCWATHYMNASVFAAAERVLGRTTIPGLELAPAVKAVLLLGALLVSPLGWVYYLWIALWPVAAVIGHARPWTRRLPRDVLLIPGLAGWLWFRRTALWGQPSVLASATFASMYFWALLSLWLWTVGEARLDRGGTQADTDRIYPA